MLAQTADDGDSDDSSRGGGGQARRQRKSVAKMRAWQAAAKAKAWQGVVVGGSIGEAAARGVIDVPDGNTRLKPASLRVPTATRGPPHHHWPFTAPTTTPPTATPHPPPRGMSYVAYIGNQPPIWVTARTFSALYLYHHTDIRLPVTFSTTPPPPACNFTPFRGRLRIFSGCILCNLVFIHIPCMACACMLLNYTCALRGRALPLT